VLLWTEDGAGTGNSNPPDESFSWNLIVFHAVNTNESTGAAKACLTMDSDSSAVRLGKVLLTATDKFVNNILWWNRTVHENKILVIDFIFGKRIFIVFWVIKSNNFSHFEMVENVYIAGGTMPVGTLSWSAVNRAHKSHKLARNDPVEVTIFDSLVVFIFFDTKFVRIVPTLSDSKLEALKAVLYCASVVAVSLASIAIVS
jgi:hypothetical protein